MKQFNKKALLLLSGGHFTVDIYHGALPAMLSHLLRDPAHLRIHQRSELTGLAAA